ncbi:UDP-glucose 4-epimerase GalE [bacterium]|nr:UDP-glucose 4-epimerase GalE [bacterium]
MKILVVGGAGYIGSIAVKNLIRQNYEVVIFDNLSTGNECLINKDAKFFRGDLLDFNEISQVFKNEKIGAVMHFAAFSQVGESVKNPQKYFINNISGSLNLFKAVLENDVKKIIFSSSASIFGEPKTVPIIEEAEKNPTSPYGTTKLMIENILSDYDKAYGLKSVCLRYFNAAGADSEGKFGEMHDPETHLIPLVLKTAKGERDAIKIFGTDYKTKDGTCIRDYIHVEDLISAHISALDFLNKENKSEKFNLGSEKGYSVREIIEKCKKITGINFKVEETERRAGDPAKLIASSEKIKKKLGWKPTKNLDNIVKDAWKWEKKM